MIESLKRQKDLTSIIPVAIYSTDRNGLITYYNDKAAELWGRRPRLNDPNELLFCGSWKIYDTEGKLLPHEKCPMAVALSEKRNIRNKEICFERPNGSKVVVHVNIDLIRGASGEISGAINVLYDFSENEKPDHNQSWLAAIVESSQDAIISKTLDGTVTSWNSGAQKIYGFTREEVIGRSISLIIPAHCFVEEIEILEKIRRGERVEHFETTRVTKDGRLIYISLSVSPIKDKYGRIIGASKISRDITERVRLNQKLEEYNRRLSELIKNKDEFIALASHELKTPTTTIKGYLQMVEEEISLPEHKQYIGKTLKQVEKLTGLISDMLDVTKMQEGKLRMNFSSFNINQLVQESVAKFLASERKHEVELLDADTANLDIVADRKRIEQVILSILANAVKYSPNSYRIDIASRCTDSHFILSIRDYGLGIPTDNLEKIFTRFYRIDRTDFSSGLGIGLYIAKEIVTEHRGKIWVESEEGKGATFHFSLPR